MREDDRNSAAFPALITPSARSRSPPVYDGLKVRSADPHNPWPAFYAIVAPLLKDDGSERRRAHLPCTTWLGSFRSALGGWNTCIAASSAHRPALVGRL